MEDIEKFVHAVNNGRDEDAKKLLEKVLKEKVAKKITTDLNIQKK